MPNRRRSGCLRPLIVLMLIVVIFAAVSFVLPTPAADGVDPRTLADPNGQFLTVDGVQLYLVDRGSGTPVIFLHGLFGSTHVWRYNLEAVAAAGFRAIAFDRPGAGLSDKPESFNYGYPRNADLIAKLMDALEIKQAVIVGHSAGGGLAGHFALRYPDRVLKLVWVDAAVIGAAGPPPFVGGLIGLAPVWRWARAILPALLNEGQLRETLKAFYVNPSFLTEADYAGYLRVLRTANWDVGLLGLTRDAGPNRLTDADLAAISARVGARTLILWGEKDTVTPFESGQQLAARIAGSTFQSFPNVGHQPHEEASDAFNTALIAYLKR